jgi:hypothetical protein
MQPFVSLTGHTRDFDNTINQNTGYSRLTLGFQHANLFDRDHVLTLAYTTSPEYISSVTQFGAFYWLPFYGYNTSLNAYWTKSDINTGTVGLGGQRRLTRCRDSAKSITTYRWRWTTVTSKARSLPPGCCKSFPLAAVRFRCAIQRGMND